MKETTDMRENWLRLINQMLKQADTLTVRQAYYLLLGFIGKKNGVQFGCRKYHVKIRKFLLTYVLIRAIIWTDKGKGGRE